MRIEAENIVTGRYYYCAVSPYEPLVVCYLNEDGVFMPRNPNTKWLFERIYGVYE